MIKKLEIKNLKKSFVKNNEGFSVFEKVNFFVMEGEFVSILGPSGCGKSTLLRQIAGFDEPDDGEILLYGEKIKKPDANRVLVFQDFDQLFPWKTVLENVMLPLKVNKIGNSSDERKLTAQKYLSKVKLDGFHHYYPYQLSGGMKQRVAIARALALNPKVLLMDEPFGSLDAQTRNNLQKMLLEIWEDTGVTIVFVTHDIQEAILLSDRIIILSKEDKGINKIIDNQLERPRNQREPKFSALWEEIYGLLES